MFNQKGFANIILIIVIVVLIGATGYVKFIKKSTVSSVDDHPKLSERKQQQTVSSTANNISSQVRQSSKITDWEIYKNEEYGFEVMYPENLTLRDGSKDYKTTGLDNFYQFCNKVVTTPDDQPIGQNDNFVGYCDGEFFRVNIWKPVIEMKTIANDFAMLKLNKENKITIGGKTASDFIYSGYSNILGGTHTWHLFVVKTNNYTYSITGDFCMDGHNKCNQILSTFKFDKQ